MKYLTDYETKAAYDAVKKDLPKPQIALVRDDYKVHFKPNKHDYSQDYLTIVAKENGTIMFRYYWESYEGDNTSMSYSVNDGNWVTTQYEGGKEIYVNVSNGDKVRWKGINNTLTYDTGEGLDNSYFSCDFEFDVEGNIMSLLYGDNFTDKVTLTKRAALGAIFRDNEKFTSAKNLILPATSLSSSAYCETFSGCTSLTETPELPATTLADGCYHGMFAGCTSLTEAPQLPATMLAERCYQEMFRDCTSLTEAPELLATTLTNWCYYGMFYGCNRLNYIKCLATNISASNCTYIWVDSVASSGTFIRDVNTSWSTGDSGIPYGWDVEPPLPYTPVT